MNRSKSVSRLRVKVIPKAAHNAVVGWIGDSLKVRVTAAPERGKANSAVVALLASALGVSREQVVIVAGATSAQKLVEISGLLETEVRARLADTRPVSRRR